MLRYLRPGDKRLELPDPAARGLYVIVEPSGFKSFAVRFRFDGKPKKLSPWLEHVHRVYPNDAASSRTALTVAVYTPVRNDAAKDGMWKINGKRHRWSLAREVLHLR